MVVRDPYRDDTLVVREQTYRRQLGEEAIDEAALVRGLSLVLGDFSRDVADVLSQLPKPRPPAPSPID